MAPALVVRVAANLEEFRKGLKDVDGQIVALGPQMERLTKSFQGEKLVMAAHNVTAAIQKVGVATLNTSEGARSLDLLDKAMDKLLRTGQQVPAEMMKTAAELRRMARATDEADKTVMGISQSYRQFDGILQSLGINIGPYVKGLEDITNLVRNGIPSLGLFGGAAAVVATALASWKVGEHIGKTTGLTDTIARGTAALRGYGDVAQETAMAVADATDAIGHHDAMLKKQAKSIEDAKKATADHSEETRRNWSVTEGNADALANLQRQLDAAAKKRKDDAIATFQASQAQEVYRSEAHFTTEVIVEQTEAIEDRLAALAKEEAARKKAVADFMNAPTLNDRASQSFSSSINPLTKSELTALGTRTGGGAFDEQLLRDKLAYLEGREGTIKPTNNKEFFALQREQVLLAQLRMYFQGIGRPESLEGLAGGTRNWRGGQAMVGERGPEIVNLPRGSDVIPNHQIGQSITIAPTIVFKGPVVGTSGEVRAFIEAALLDIFKSGGLPLPG